MKKETKKEQNFSIVLNGGKEIKNATLPVRWFFSKKLANKKPTHIVLVDLTEKDLGLFSTNNRGRRYLYSVDQALTFLQTRKSGKHTLLALAFDSREIAVAFLEGSQNYYYSDIDVETILNGKKWSNSIATTFVEFEIPEECFAKPPQSKAGKIWWKFLFWPNKPKAIDECQIRKISWFYALPKLVIFIIAQFFMLLIGALNSIRIILARPFFWFFGYSLTPLSKIKEGISESFSIYFDQISYDADIIDGYRLDVYKDGVYIRERKFAPLDVFIFCFLILFFLFGLFMLVSKKTFISPGVDSFIAFLSWIVTPLVLASLVYSGKLFKANKLAFIFSILLSAFPALLFLCSSIFMAFSTNSGLEIDFGPIVIFVILVAITISTINKRIRKNKKESPVEVWVKEQKKYEEYLKESFTDLKKKEIPKETFFSNKLVRDLKILFWKTKSNVCRPFEED